MHQVKNRALLACLALAVLLLAARALGGEAQGLLSGRHWEKGDLPHLRLWV